MFHSYKKTIFKLNDQLIPVNSVDISVNTQINHLTLSNERSPTKYAATRGVFGRCRLSYYITGQELLKSYFINTDSPISGNLAGLYFNSGYLTSYTFTAGPNEPIVATAELAFFEPLRGSMNPSGQNVTGITPLNVCDMTVSADIDSFGNIENISNISYSYSTNIEPLFHNQLYDGSGDLTPTRVVATEKEINCEVSFDNYNYNLLFTGNRSNIVINLNGADGVNKESFIIYGQITSKNINSSANQFVNSTFAIKQNSIFIEPSVSGFFPVTGRANDDITISGSGLSSTFSVIFAGLGGKKGRPSHSVTVNPTNIVAKVPSFAVDGPIIVLTAGGEAQSAGIFDVKNTFGPF